MGLVLDISSVNLVWAIHVETRNNLEDTSIHSQEGGSLKEGLRDHALKVQGVGRERDLGWNLRNPNIKGGGIGKRAQKNKRKTKKKRCQRTNVLRRGRSLQSHPAVGSCETSHGIQACSTSQRSLGI